MSVNLDGVVLCYKYAAAQMIKQGNGGRLIGTYLFLKVPSFYENLTSRAAASSICGKRGLPESSSLKTFVTAIVRLCSTYRLLRVQIRHSRSDTVSWCVTLRYSDRAAPHKSQRWNSPSIISPLMHMRQA